jgi:hypothetical protein
MMPSDMAATPERSIEKVSLAPLFPAAAARSSLSPSRRSLPARTSERKSSPVGELWSPILRIGFDCTRPDMPRSRTKCRIFRSWGSTPGSSSLQMKTIVSAYGPFVMKVLLPFSR